MKLRAMTLLTNFLSSVSVFNARSQQYEDAYVCIPLLANKAVSAAPHACIVCSREHVVETDTEFFLSIPFIKLKMYGNIFFRGGGGVNFFTACFCCVILFGL